MYVYNGARKTSRVIVEAPFRYSPEIRWYGNRYVEVVIGTGSPGNYSIFYDTQSDIVSEEMWFVVAFDKRRGIAVLGQDRIIVTDVFRNKELFEIKPVDLPITAVTFLVIENCRFTKNGDIQLKYTNVDDISKKYVVKSSYIDMRQKLESKIRVSTGQHP